MRELRGITSIILSFCMVMVGTMTSFAKESPVQYFGVDSFEDVSVNGLDALSDIQSGTFYIRGNGIALRGGPSLSAQREGLLYQNANDWVTVNGIEQMGDGIIWLLVVASSTGVTGWISSDYVNFDRPLD